MRMVTLLYGLQLRFKISSEKNHYSPIRILNLSSTLDGLMSANQISPLAICATVGLLHLQSLDPTVVFRRSLRLSRLCGDKCCLFE